MTKIQKVKLDISQSLELLANVIVNDSEGSQLKNDSSFDFWAEVEHTSEYKSVVESNMACSMDARFLLSNEIADTAE